jgi:ferritin-like metal-binding protein YciE
MAELKTKPTGESVVEFLDSIKDDQKRQDCHALSGMMQQATGSQPEMWGSSIVGFGRYHYRYASGREGDWFLAGFSPRKQNLTLYIMAGFDRYESLLAQLGKHTTGKSCLYIKKLADVDQDILQELIKLSADHIARTNT